MKKLFCMLLSIILTISLAGCCLPIGDDEVADDNDYEYDYSSSESEKHEKEEITVDDIKTSLAEWLEEDGVDSDFTDEKTENKSDKTIHTFKFLNSQVTVQIETSVGDDKVNAVACWAFPSSFVSMGFTESEALKYSALFCVAPLAIFENNTDADSLNADVDSLYQKILNDGTSSTDDTTAYWEYESDNCTYSLAVNSLTTMTTAKPF